MEQIQRLQQTFDQLYQQEDYHGLFDSMYQQAQQGSVKLPWVQLKGNGNPLFLDWAQSANLSGDSGDGRKSALVVGSGLGDDAEALDHLKFQVTAFDFSKTALDWCRERFPHSHVQYRELDLFALPPEWQQRFDFVLDVLTLPSLPAARRTEAIDCIARTIAPGGTLFVITFGGDTPVTQGKIPLPLTRSEVDQFQHHGLQERSFEQFTEGKTGLKLFRVVYQRPE
jgi:SAM-dependent methyltransferase